MRRRAGGCKRADFAKVHWPKPASVEIDKTQATPARGDLRRQRVVPERAAAEMRHDPANIGYCLGLHAEEDQADSIRPNDVERDLGEAEEAGRIAGRGESVDERRLDEIEVGLAVI